MFPARVLHDLAHQYVADRYPFLCDLALESAFVDRLSVGWLVRVRVPGAFFHVSVIVDEHAHARQASADELRQGDQVWPGALQWWPARQDRDAT